MGKIKQWLETGKHLPELMRDFHDQKNLFKCMHKLYSGSEEAEKKPNWIQGHTYIIDWFLWYMAGRGYTLQKSRKNIKFLDFENFNDLLKTEGNE